MPCYFHEMKDGGRMILCGDLGPHCADCADLGENLCDFPVGDGKTCDRPICDKHSNEIGPNLHYCDGHYKAWSEFRDAGGVKRELENVVPYKQKTGSPTVEELTINMDGCQIFVDGENATTGYRTKPGRLVPQSITANCPTPPVDPLPDHF